MNKQDKIQRITLSAKKFLEDKKLISAYLRGEVNKKELDERGIKLAMPVYKKFILDKHKKNINH